MKSSNLSLNGLQFYYMSQIITSLRMEEKVPLIRLKVLNEGAN